MPAGRLVEDQHLGVGEEPFAQHHLLLVAAGEIADLLQDIVAADPQLRAIVRGDVEYRVIVDHEPHPGYARQVGKCYVPGDALAENQPGPLAILGHIGNAMTDRPGDGRRVDFLAVEVNGAADMLAEQAAEDAQCQLGAARAHQAGNTDDLTLADLQVDRPDRLAIMVGGVHDPPVADLEHGFAELRFAAGITVGEFAADHGLDDPWFGNLAGRIAHHVDGAAIADDGDGVRDAGDLVQLVRDDDQRHPLRLQLKHQVEQGIAVALVQAGGRLVEDHQLDVLRQRLRDLDQLLFADAKVADQRLGRFHQPDPSQQHAGLGVGGGPVDEARLRLLIAEEEVLGDRKHRRQGELLVDDADPGVLAVAQTLRSASPHSRR